MNRKSLETNHIKTSSAQMAAFCAMTLVWLAFTCAAAAQTTNIASTPHWFDAKDLGIEGKGWMDTKHSYDRLPAKAEGVVRDAVWWLSHDSAGIAVRFVTDATAISVRWTVRKESLAMSHMPASGVSGVDLYVRHKGEWRWLGAARPEKSVTTEKTLVSGMRSERRECLLYLPLYNGVERVEIGVPAEAICERPPPRPRRMKPVVYYGTSILQGGCASRPGMAYPAILGRRLDWTTINLGFSGNAQSEPEMAALLAELDPAVYVLDPLPNMRPEWVTERMSTFIAKLRDAHPQTPIMLVEHGGVGNARVVGTSQAGYAKSNALLRHLYDQRRRAGDRKLFYVRGEKLMGEDGQGTVDGVHATDLGFMRMADAIEPTLKRALRAAK